MREGLEYKMILTNQKKKLPKFKMVPTEGKQNDSIREKQE